MVSRIRRFAHSLPGWPHIRRVYRGIIGIGSTGQPWARIVMNRETLRWIEGLRPETLDTLEISGGDWKDRARFKSYRSVEYPEFDLTTDVLEERFDLIIAEQVFEHIQRPYPAAKNVYAMLKPGGYFLITTPFMLRVHAYPTDCSRWTEEGMKYFLAECGFPLEQIETASWGNRACVKANFIEWREYRPWLHSLKNEPNFPVSVWALARK